VNRLRIPIIQWQFLAKSHCRESIIRAVSVSGFIFPMQAFIDNRDRISPILENRTNVAGKEPAA